MRRPNPTRTETAEVGPGRPPGTQPCLTRIFACDRPLALPIRHPLGGLARVIIGRGPDSFELAGTRGPRTLAVRCADGWLSGAHLQLDRVLGRWIVSDAGSKNGTQLNGLAIGRAPLADGDLIEAGQTFFLFRDAIAGLGDSPVERRLPLSAGMEDQEDFGLAMAAALHRSGGGRVRLLPSTVRLLLAAWPVDLERSLRAAQVAAAGSPLAPGHLPTPLPRSPAAPHPRFDLEGEFWTVVFDGATVRLRDSDGMRYLACLVDRPGAEVHVHELLRLGRHRGLGETGGAGGPDRDPGDAGPLLDAAAKAAYRRRLEDLQAMEHEASGFGDATRAARAREEIEFLAAELARAVGLGGRDRKASSSAERARVNVTLRIRGAMKRLAASAPRIGLHLEAAIRTGTFCCYAPG